jgi:hypothetical protein
MDRCICHLLYIYCMKNEIGKQKFVSSLIFVNNSMITREEGQYLPLS